VNLPVATFTDPGGAEIDSSVIIGQPPSVSKHYQATINWGDGTTPSAATITVNGTPFSKTAVFSVLGNHLYTGNGNFPVSVAIIHEGITSQAKSSIAVTSVLNHAQINNETNVLAIGADLAGDQIRVSPVGSQNGTSADVVSVSLRGIVSQGNFTGFNNIVIYGQDGNDNINVSPGILKAASIFGGKGNDLLSGGSGNDLLEGGDGNDTLVGNDGDDILHGGAGDDTLDGGAGKNTLDGGTGLDGVVVHGTQGNDEILVGWQLGPRGAQLVLQINGKMSVQDYTSGETVFVFGGKGNDFIKMLPSNATHWKAEFHGEEGNDILWGGDLDDLLDGGDGNDLLYGGIGNDLLLGGAGNDILLGGAGQNIFDGGTGADVAIDGPRGHLLIAWLAQRRR